MIVLLTYNAPHRKTEDVAWRLLSQEDKWKGHDLIVLATEWIVRKPRHPLVSHRPAEPHWPTEATVPLKEWTRTLGLELRVCKAEELADKVRKIAPDLIVVGGAGILASEIVMDYKVLNVHPGRLPMQRGLDAFKWAIARCEQIGVTSHLVDADADLGWRIDEKPVPCYVDDTIHSLAMRQYEYELSLLVPGVVYALQHDKESIPKIVAGDTVATRRMPRNIEEGLGDFFELYKRQWSVNGDT